MTFLRHLPLATAVFLLTIAGTRADTPSDADAEPTDRGQRTTDAAAAPRPDEDGWYSLFNGKDLAGWKLTKDNPDTFQAVDGQIVAHGSQCHLFYIGPVNEGRFKNFEFKCDVLTKPGSNAGVYFHTKYQPTGWPAHGLEVQINNTHADPRKTGSIYRASDVMNDSPAKDDQWFTLHVIVRDRHIVVKVDDRVVNDHTEPKNPQRDRGWEHNVLSPKGGTFALQGHDPESEVHFRNIKVKPLP